MNAAFSDAAANTVIDGIAGPELQPVSPVEPAASMIATAPETTRVRHMANKPIGDRKRGEAGRWGHLPLAGDGSPTPTPAIASTAKRA
ncbi:hypothetical protein MNVM_41080 [Mycobacterium novum]|uniref:Uncharacterized protein n=1 Tax=Mycobacterium novum TaxID=2492438 RepID=A0A7I7JT37_9MYCO|nr:hypothetical protein MNVM_41080 [Mycobacterium novum]